MSIKIMYVYTCLCIYIYICLYPRGRLDCGIQFSTPQNISLKTDHPYSTSGSCSSVAYILQSHLGYSLFQKKLISKPGIIWKYHPEFFPVTGRFPGRLVTHSPRCGIAGLEVLSTHYTQQCLP